MERTQRYHGFVRDASGNITVIDVPHAFATAAYTINDSGIIAGNFADEHQRYHGFVRDQSGNLTIFDVPGALLGARVWSINNSGDIAGDFEDENQRFHDFIWCPTRLVRALAGLNWLWLPTAQTSFCPRYCRALLGPA